MRILLLCSTFNSLSQRLFVDLRAAGHAVAVEIDANERLLNEAVARFRPDVLLAPYLRRAIPASTLALVPCLVVHPGPPGDGGPSALDHALLLGLRQWGVTVLRATPKLDEGPVLAWRPVVLRDAPKSDVYRTEVQAAAVPAVFEALDRLARGEAGEVPAQHTWRPRVEDEARAVDFTVDTTATVLRKVRSADGMPGALATLGGARVRVFDVHVEGTLAGRPGQVLARREGALAVATSDGAVWVGHAKALPGEDAAERPFKQAATTLLPALAAQVAESPMPHPAEVPARPTLQDIRYREENAVGRLSFDFYNGGMTVAQAHRLVNAIHHAAERRVRVLVLEGGKQMWSNGLDLMSIEASANPAQTSWDTINAVDDVCLAILTLTGTHTIAALGGSAGAGGVFVALACDQVLLRDGVVLNPHYKNMGNLHGSEYWTYVLPRRLGPEGTRTVMAARLPVGAAEALRLKLADGVGPSEREEFHEHVARLAAGLAADPALPARLEEKARQRAEDEAHKPLARYREEELQRMRQNFFGFDPSYHVARYNFIAKVPQSRTPHHLAEP